MKLKHPRWRDAVVRHLFNNGPMILSQINNELKNRDGLRFKAIPTTNQGAGVLRLDKRIMLREVSGPARGLGGGGGYTVYEYAADLLYLKEIGWDQY